MMKLMLAAALLCAACGPKYPSPDKCKATVLLRADSEADRLCPSDSVKWDDCEHREGLMADLRDGLGACDADR